MNVCSFLSTLHPEYIYHLKFTPRLPLTIRCTVCKEVSCQSTWNSWKVYYFFFWLENRYPSFWTFQASHKYIKEPGYQMFNIYEREREIQWYSGLFWNIVLENWIVIILNNNFQCFFTINLFHWPEFMVSLLFLYFNTSKVMGKSHI